MVWQRIIFIHEINQESNLMSFEKYIKAIKLSWLSLFGSKKSKYESRHHLLSALAFANNFRLYNRNLAWINDAEYLSVWTKFPRHKNNIHERKFNLYYIAKSVKNIPGDIAECGVFHGGSSFLMLEASVGSKKHLHGFDSFEGLSEPKDVDLNSPDYTFKWVKNDMRFDMSTTEKNLEKFKGSFTLYKGWIPSRFNEVKDKKFSFVHIDVDLYEPTKDALEFFYSRMSPGGVLLCDDYGSLACPGAKKAMDEFFSDKKEKTVIHLTTGQGMVLKH